MIIAEIAQIGEPIRGLEAIAPFVYRTAAKYFSLAPFWITTFGIIDDSTKNRISIIEVIQDNTNKYILTESENDCKSQESSFYWDIENQVLYIHINHDYSPLTCTLQYGYAFGITDESIVYINDVEYIPLILSAPEVEVSADFVAASQPTYISGSLKLNNRAIGKDGPIDFIIDESIIGSDVFIKYYDQLTGIIKPIQSFYVEDYEHSIEEITLNLQDKRKQDNIKVPSGIFGKDLYKDIDDSLIGELIPIIYGPIHGIRCKCINSNLDPDNSSIKARYRLPDGITNIGSVYVYIDDTWAEATNPVADYNSKILTIDNGRSSDGASYELKLVNCIGIQINGHSYPSDVIIDLNKRFAKVEYLESNYEIDEWVIESGSSFMQADIGFAITEESELSDVIYQIENKSKNIFRYEYSPNGKRTIRVRDYERTITSVINSVDIINKDKIPVETKSTDTYSSILLKYAHNYAEENDLSLENYAHEREVLSRYRIRNQLIEETWLIDESTASERAAVDAFALANIPRIATLELFGYLNIKIFEVYQIYLQFDDEDGESRQYYGQRSCLILSIKPNISQHKNKITALILPDEITFANEIRIIASEYSNISRNPSASPSSIASAALSISQSVSLALPGMLEKKIDVTPGKILSDNNYTTEEKNKLAGIESGAQVNTVKSVSGRTGEITLGKSDVGLGNVDNTSDANKPVSTAQQTALGAKADLVDGKVPSSQLPSYVDDVIDAYIVGSVDYASDWLSLSAGGPALTPESGKIYIILTSGTYNLREFRWSGSVYAQVNEGIALGETSATAYRGDRGKTAYDHSQSTGNPHSTSKSDIGLGNVDNTSDANKPVSTAQASALALKLDATAQATDSAKLAGVTPGSGGLAIIDDPDVATIRTTLGLGDSATKNVGMAAGTVAAGNDSRFFDARTPMTHATSHKNGGTDEIATATAAANSIPKADANGKLDTWVSDASTSTKGKVQLAADGGTTAGQAAQASDSRLSNSRTPTSHKSTHAIGGTDVLSPADIGALAAAAQATDSAKIGGVTPGAGGLLLAALSALSSATPQPLGTASAGTSNIPSRQDHVHPASTGSSGKWPSDINLFAWYSFDLGGWDESKNQAHGTLQGTTSVTGIFGRARSFNGSSDYISLSPGKYANIQGAFTISMWISGATRSGTQWLFFRSGLSDTYHRGIVILLYNNLPGLYISENGSSFISVLADAGDECTNDCFLTFKYSPSNYMRIYKNGVLIKEITSNIPASSFYNSTQDCRIGGYTANFFSGWIDELSVYSAVLTNDEIWGLYTQVAKRNNNICETNGVDISTGTLSNGDSYVIPDGEYYITLRCLTAAGNAIALRIRTFEVLRVEYSDFASSISLRITIKDGIGVIYGYGTSGGSWQLIKV